MSRFFVSRNDIENNKIFIHGEDVNHIKKVLRLRCGEKLTLCDGAGNDYEVEITALEPDRVVTAILSQKKSQTEPPIEVTLFQGIPKSDKMDFIIQKSIELGIARIVPVSTERTVVRFEGDKDACRKVERWQRIALEAAKQCNRGIVPVVEMPVSFPKALELVSQAELGLIPYERENESRLRRQISSKGIGRIAVMIGPEGGFSEEEVCKALRSGVRPVTLGPRILRTETAGIAVLSILMYELGDVG